MADDEGRKPSFDVSDAPQPDFDFVFSTVVAADDLRPEPGRGADLFGPPSDVDQPAAAPGGQEGAGPTGPPAGLEERLAALESLPGTVESLGQAIRHELERCAGVLFAHDRALTESREGLGALAARIEPLEAPKAAPAEEPDSERARLYDEALARILDQLDTLGQRLAGAEARLEPVEPLPAVVQALRRAVRANDDAVAGEVTAREREMAALASELATLAQARDETLRRLMAQDLDRVAAVAAAQAQVLDEVAGRLGAAEGRLVPLDSLPEDVAALSRILRRELDGVTADNQARDQLLRRALQNEIDQIRAASESREGDALAAVARLAELEARVAESAAAHDDALSAATGGLEALEGRVGAVDGLGAELESLGTAVRKALEELRAEGQAHDQVVGELTRRLSALDARLARFDGVPGEVQSLRTEMRQEAEHTISQLRVAEERVGQLAWVPGEFQEARKRIIALTSGLKLGQDSLRALEAAIAATNQRLEALRAGVATGDGPGPRR